MFDTIHNHYNEFDDKHIIKLLKHIIMTQAEAAAKLGTVATQLTKVREEVQKLLDAAANDQNVSPELQAAIDAVATATQGVDDLNPDEAIEEPTDPEQPA